MVIFPTGVGKTQFSLFLTTKTSISDGGGNVLYIDTKNDFCVERLVEMVDADLSVNGGPMRAEDALERIRVSKAHDLTTLINVLRCIDDSKVSTISLSFLLSFFLLNRFILTTPCLSLSGEAELNPNRVCLTCTIWAL